MNFIHFNINIVFFYLQLNQFLFVYLCALQKLSWVKWFFVYVTIYQSHNLLHHYPPMILYIRSFIEVFSDADFHDIDGKISKYIFLWPPLFVFLYWSHAYDTLPVADPSSIRHSVCYNQPFFKICQTGSLVLKGKDGPSALINSAYFGINIVRIELLLHIPLKTKKVM